MEIDQTKIEQAIVDQAAREIISNDEIYRRVQLAVDKRIEDAFQEGADKQIRKAVEDAIVAGFERPFRKVTAYGEPKGEPTTISKELENIIHGYWNQKVNSKGEASDSYGSTTRAEWTMIQLVAKDFHKDVQQHIVDLGASLKDALRKNLHETVNRMLSEIFHVRSWDDQKLNNPGRSCIDPPESPKL